MAAPAEELGYLNSSWTLSFMVNLTLLTTNALFFGIITFPLFFKSDNGLGEANLIIHTGSSISIFLYAIRDIRVRFVILANFLDLSLILYSVCYTGNAKFQIGPLDSWQSRLSSVLFFQYCLSLATS
jgi:hypothetical protein